MVETIFDLAKVNIVPSNCRSLSQIASTQLDSLAYIESTTFATDDIEHIDNNKKC